MTVKTKKHTKTVKKTVKATKKLSKAEKYAKDIIDGKIIACLWVRLACQRYFDDLDNAEAKGLFFDEQSATRAIKFFSCLKHSKGEWAGTPFWLEPWQEFIVWNLFGWKRKSDGFRRFRTAYLEVSRKNGKTTIISGIGLYLMVADDEPGAEVYFASTKRDQSLIAYSEASRMASSSEVLKNIVGIFKNNLHIESKACKMEPLGADADTMDGLNVHGALVDELHAHKTRDCWDRLETATSARRQPLQIAITTAGFDRNTICFEQHGYSERVLDKSINDETFFCMIYTIDKDDKWDDEANWIKANPNLHISVKPDDLRRKAEKAKEMPSQLNSFLRMHLDIWTESVTRWISAEKWEMCGTSVIEHALNGRPCYGGLDLSSTLDISALVYAFPPQDDADKFQVLCRFFIPEDNMWERVRRDRVPYDVWVREGHITATPGNVIDYAFILNTLSVDGQKFDIKEIAFDRWGATKIVQDLAEMGFEKPTNNRFATQRLLIDFGQGFASMNAPTKELEKLILSQMLMHGNNPVLKWMASNVVIKMDPAGNVKPDKGQSIDRIDGIVALIMAISRAVLFTGNEQPRITII